MTLLNSKVLLLPLDVEEEVSAGGVHMADKTQATQDRAVVIATGPGRMMPPHNDIIPNISQPGNRVIFNPAYGMDVRFEGKRMVVTDDAHLIAILDEGEK